MPYYHCSKCHHEWEAAEEELCDWCGEPAGEVLEQKTPLEKFVVWLTDGNRSLEIDDD